MCSCTASLQPGASEQKENSMPVCSFSRFSGGPNNLKSCLIKTKWAQLVSLYTCASLGGKQKYYVTLGYSLGGFVRSCEAWVWHLWLEFSGDAGRCSMVCTAGSHMEEERKLEQQRRYREWERGRRQRPLMGKLSSSTATAITTTTTLFFYDSSSPLFSSSAHSLLGIRDKFSRADQTQRWHLIRI